MAQWRLAKSLETLRAQVNALSPNRSKASDGSIGDAAHAARPSDHNPDAKGVVKALDITHDPAHGIDGAQLAEIVKTDPRVKYVIWNRRIWNPTVAKKWRPSSGHEKHVHISVGPHFDSTAPWALGLNVPAEVAQKPAEPHQPILRLGSKGKDVAFLQALLNKHGASLKADEDFGPITKAAVIKFQQAHDLVPDGIVGAYTWEALNG